MTYAERFPNIAKLENRAVRAYYYSMLHTWIIFKREFPPDPENLPPNVARCVKHFQDYVGNPMERMFLFPVGNARCVYRDPETGEESPIDDPWAEFYWYIDNASNVAASNHCVCRESGTGSFECGQTCYSDGFMCQCFLGPSSVKGIPEVTYEISKEEMRFRTRMAQRQGDLILMYGYGPPDPSMHYMAPVDHAMTVGFCPNSKTNGYSPIWHQILDGDVTTRQVYQMEIDQDKCDGCGRCVSLCNLGEIAVDPDSDKAYLKSKKYCTGCGRCQTTCQAGAITIFTNIKDRDAFMHSELDARICVTNDPCPYDPDITPYKVVDCSEESVKDDWDYWEKNWDVDKIYADWKAEKEKKAKAKK